MSRYSHFSLIIIYLICTHFNFTTSALPHLFFEGVWFFYLIFHFLCMFVSETEWPIQGFWIILCCIDFNFTNVLSSGWIFLYILWDVFNLGRRFSLFLCFKMTQLKVLLLRVKMVVSWQVDFVPMPTYSNPNMDL